jgi:hypothetical protein
MSSNLAGSYVLGGNIDASATSTWNEDPANPGTYFGFDPIGNTGTEFTGSLDGNGYIISGLFINRPTEDEVGLFGYASGAVRDIGLTSVNITGKDYVGGLAGVTQGLSVSTDFYVTGAVTGVNYVGGLIGWVWSSGTIDDSYFSGTVTASGYYVGGLVGSNECSITHSYSTGTVSSSSYSAGGLVGLMGEASSIINTSYSTADVTGIDYTGGLVGDFFFGTGTITNCYARGDVTGDDMVGGLVGRVAGGSVDKSYSTGAVTGTSNVGGLTGGTGGEATTNSYWDTQTSGQATSNGGTGKTTVQMKLQTTYSGWNFTTIWSIDTITNDGYPYLVDYIACRCFTIPSLYDKKGRVAKGARVQAFRDDTHVLVKEGTIDSTGNATICGLPNNVDITFHVTWGGSSASGEERWFYSKVNAVTEGGTGSSTIPGARTNLGLVVGSDIQGYDAKLNDITKIAVTDGTIIVGDGTNFVGESGATARTSLGVGTGDSPQFTGVNVGHATDTTLTRASAGGDVNVEGNLMYRAGGTDVPVADGGTGASTAATALTNLGAASSSALTIHAGLTTGTHGVAGTIVGTSDSQTLTTKTIIATSNVVEEITTTASSATPTPTGGSLRNLFTVTALAETATFAAPSGTPANGNKLIIRIIDNGTARTLAWNAIYRSLEYALPTTTVISETLYLGFIYNSADSKWDFVAADAQVESNRNGIINGGFRVAQRGTSFTAASTPLNSDDTFLLDRWILLSDGNDIVDVSQSTTVIPTGATASIKLLVATANKQFGILNILENKDAMRFIGRTVSLSFQARMAASDDNTHSLRANILSWSSTADAVTSDAVNTWAAPITSFATNWTAENTAASNTLTTSFQTFKIEGVSIDTASTANIAVLIYCDQTDGVADDAIYITQVQLELGAIATPFEIRPFAQELALCQRYYLRIIQTATNWFMTGFAYATIDAVFAYSSTVTMRAAPTLGQSGTFTFLSSDGVKSGTLSLGGSTIDGCVLIMTDTGYTAGHGCLLRGGAYIEFLAEL